MPYGYEKILIWFAKYQQQSLAANNDLSEIPYINTKNPTNTSVFAQYEKTLRVREKLAGLRDGLLQVQLEFSLMLPPHSGGIKFKRHWIDTLKRAYDAESRTIQGLDIALEVQRDLLKDSKWG